MSVSELRATLKRTQHGDWSAMQRLVDYYWISEDDTPRALYGWNDWRLAGTMSRLNR